MRIVLQYIHLPDNMSKNDKFESRARKKIVFKPDHMEPFGFCLDFILLPYGEYYEKTRDFKNAKKGDILRFFNGPEYEIFNVSLIKQDKFCDLLCRMRYGIPWSVAFEKWTRYAVLEGHGKGVLSKEECFLVVYDKKTEK